MLLPHRGFCVFGVKVALRITSPMYRRFPCEPYLRHRAVHRDLREIRQLVRFLELRSPAASEERFRARERERAVLSV